MCIGKGKGGGGTNAVHTLLRVCSCIPSDKHFTCFEPPDLVFHWPLMHLCAQSLHSFCSVWCAVSLHGWGCSCEVLAFLALRFQHSLK